MTTLRVGMGTQTKRCVPRCRCTIVFDETARFTLGHHRALQRRVRRAEESEKGDIVRRDQTGCRIVPANKSEDMHIEDGADNAYTSSVLYGADGVDQYNVQERVDGTDS
jgi:hypothetical protein